MFFCEEMKTRPQAQGILEKVEFVEVPVAKPEIKPKHKCPVPDCTSSGFGSLAGQRSHIRSYHNDVKEEYLQSNKVLNPKTNRWVFPGTVDAYCAQTTS